MDKIARPIAFTEKSWRDLACHTAFAATKVYIKAINQSWIESSRSSHCCRHRQATGRNKLDNRISVLTCGWRSSRVKIGTNCLKLYSKDNILRSFKFSYHILTFKFPAPLPKGAQNGLLDDGIKATVALKALKYLYVNFGLLTVVPMKTEIFNSTL